MRLENGTSDLAHHRFAQIVQPHLGDALTLARWLTGSRADAEDVTQEACIRAMAGLDGFRGGQARAWILAIVRNCAWSWIARNHPRQLVLVEDLAKAEAAQFAANPGSMTPDTPEDALTGAQTHEQVRAALAALALPFREIIILRDINGLSYREIGEMLQLPPGTVMSRLARGRAELRKALKDE